MNTSFNLQINTPCSENFDQFKPTQKGGFCDSCQKEVIDFTHMSADQIVMYFQNNSTQKTCGRFKSEQLKTYDSPAIKRSKLSFFGGFGLAIIALFSIGKSQAQDIDNTTNILTDTPSKIQDITQEKQFVVTGTVNDNGVPLPGANVVLEGTTIGTTTDFDGNFEFPEKLKKGDVLVVSYIGFNSKRIQVQNKNSAQDITMQVNLKVDSCVLLGAVAVKKVFSSKND